MVMKRSARRRTVLLHEARARAAPRGSACAIGPRSGNVIDFPVIDDVPSLLWVINLGCIDLNQCATCDDVDRPDYVHFDLDPGQARRSTRSGSAR